MRAPSLYEYFDSKHAIYDAMFAQGYRQFAAAMVAVDALSGEERLKLGVSELGGRVAHGPGQDILQRKGQDNLFTFL